MQTSVECMESTLSIYNDDMNMKNDSQLKAKAGFLPYPQKAKG